MGLEVRISRDGGWTWSYAEYQRSRSEKGLHIRTEEGEVGI